MYQMHYAILLPGSLSGSCSVQNGTAVFCGRQKTDLHVQIRGPQLGCCCHELCCSQWKYKHCLKWVQSSLVYCGRDGPGRIWWLQTGGLGFERGRLLGGSGGLMEILNWIAFLDMQEPAFWSLTHTSDYQVGTSQPLLLYDFFLNCPNWSVYIYCSFLVKFQFL